jgi:hypothetical protein
MRVLTNPIMSKDILSYVLLLASIQQFLKINKFPCLLEVDRFSNNADVLTSLEMSFEMEKCKLSDIKLRHVTRLDFGPYISRESSKLLL